MLRATAESASPAFYHFCCPSSATSTFAAFSFLTSILASTSLPCSSGMLVILLLLCVAPVIHWDCHVSTFPSATLHAHATHICNLGVALTLFFCCFAVALLLHYFSPLFLWLVINSKKFLLKFSPPFSLFCSYFVLSSCFLPLAIIIIAFLSLYLFLNFSFSIPSVVLYQSFFALIFSNYLLQLICCINSFFITFILCSIQLDPIYFGWQFFMKL